MDSGIPSQTESMLILVEAQDMSPRHCIVIAFQFRSGVGAERLAVPGSLTDEPTEADYFS